MIIAKNPTIVDGRIFSPSIVTRKKKERKGDRYSRFEIVEADSVSFKAFSQKKKVNDISNIPICTLAKKEVHSKVGSEEFERT